MSGQKTITIAPVKKTITVEAAQAHAFEVFVSRIDLWWPKQHHIGDSPVVEQVMEPRLGGRWYTRHESGSESLTGHFTVWDPPKRIVFSWEINSQWKHEDNLALTSEVEVRFIAEGASRTRVELEHRNFERMGEEGRAMRDGVDNGWPGILDLFKAAAEA
ncbi:MAG TPA: SRPBCC family protein [Hyphomonadaceae bacterium]|nr:SRPBCC family protein [Hyphomonadaceae bacterium]